MIVAAEGLFVPLRRRLMVTALLAIKMSKLNLKGVSPTIIEQTKHGGYRTSSAKGNVKTMSNIGANLECEASKRLPLM